MKFFTSALAAVLCLGFTWGGERFATAAPVERTGGERIESSAAHERALEQRATRAGPWEGQRALSRPHEIAIEELRQERLVEAQQRAVEREVAERLLERRRAALQRTEALYSRSPFRERPSARLTRFEAIRPPTPPAVHFDATPEQLHFATTAEDYASARRGVRLLEDPSRRIKREVPLVVYDKTGQPAETVRALLRRPLKTVELIHSIPRSVQEAAKVHGEAVADVYSDAEWASLSKLPQSWGSDAHDLANGRAPGETYAASLSRRLLEAKKRGVDLSMVIGEVRSGRMLFPDGSSLAVEEMTRDGAQVAVLGCNSANWLMPASGTIGLGMGSKLDYFQTLQLGGFFLQNARSGQRSFYDILKMIQFSAFPASIGDVGRMGRSMIVVSTVLIVQPDGTMQSGAEALS